MKQTTEVTKVFEQKAILWNELRNSNKLLVAKNIYRACGLHPAMLTSIGHTKFCKLKTNSVSTETYQLVKFDKAYLLGKIKSEVLQPLGLNSLDELARILSETNEENKQV